MITDYLLIGFRNFIKNKVYAIINLLSIVIATACAFIGFLNYSYNVNFDSHLDNTSNIHRVYATYVVNADEIMLFEILLDLGKNNDQEGHPKSAFLLPRDWNFFLCSSNPVKYGYFINFVF